MPQYMDCAKVSDSDLQGNSLPAEGIAEWKIIHVEPGTSLSGSPKTVVAFKVRDCNGKVSTLMEHVPMMVDFRIARIASATGTGEMAKSGKMDVSKWLGKKGSGKIKHEKSDGYPDKAVWAYFIKDKNRAEEEASETPVEEDFTDDIPF